MQASKLIDVTVEKYSDFSLKSNSDGSAVIVEKGEKGFYFSIPPSLSDKEIEKQFTDYLSAKREAGLHATIDSKPVLIKSKYPTDGLQVKLT